MAEPFIFVDQILIILVAGIVAAKFSERVGLPPIIPLFVIGYFVGPEGLGIFVPLKLGLSLSALVTIAIPVILFEEGARTNAKLLNQFKFTVFTLATVAVLVSTAGVGVVAFLFFNMPPSTALLMGAILAATSPAAAVALTHQLKIKSKISTIIEAEASFNDATSIVLFTILTGAIVGATASIFGAFSSFVILFFGGLLVGSLLALLLIFLIKRFNMQEHVIQLSLVAFFAAFSTAEIIGSSGATAVVAAGLVFGEGQRRYFGRPTQERLRNLWSDLSLLARSIIFLVLGAGFSLMTLTSVWLQAIIVAFLLFAVIRPLSVFSATLFEKRLSRKEKFFISWVGSRGAVPAALAASAVGLGISGATQIFDIVIVVVLVSLIIVGFSARKMAKLTLSIQLREENEKKT